MSVKECIKCGTVCEISRGIVCEKCSAQYAEQHLYYPRSIFDKERILSLIEKHKKTISAYEALYNGATTEDAARILGLSPTSLPTVMYRERKAEYLITPKLAKHRNSDITYPLNLFYEVAPTSDEPSIAELKENVSLALKFLTEREQTVLLAYYEKGYNLDETAKSLGVSKQRIDQIRGKAIRKLKHAPVLEIIQYGFAVEERRQTMIKAAYEQRRNAVIERLSDETLGTVSQIKALEIPAYLQTIKLEAMGLSVRTFNCLRYAGVENAADIEQYRVTNFDELRCIRNLGQKSFDEIISKLAEIGLQDKRGNTT